MNAPCREPYEEEPGRWRLTRQTDVRAALANPRLQVPPPAPGDGPMARLRGAVSRFSNGAEHTARRSAAVEEYGRIAVAALRAEVEARVYVELAAARGGRIDLMPAARAIPVGVLATAMGVPAGLSGEVAEAVAVIAAAYPPGAAVEPVPADQAATRLEALLRNPEPGRFAALAVLLVQTCDATAGLIGNTLGQMLSCGARGTVDAAVAETLRFDPPVRATVRIVREPVSIGEVAIPAAATVILDLAAANRDPAVFADPGRFDPGRPERASLTFGSGHRLCPGDKAAFEMAAGFVEAALGCELADIRYAPSTNLRVPSRLEVIA
jgi:cytochrome P450